MYAQSRGNYEDWKMNMIKIGGPELRSYFSQASFSHLQQEGFQSTLKADIQDI